MTIVSFAVMSLFTKVPAGLANRVAHQRLTEDLSLPERSVLYEVVSLLKFCLDATCLGYREEVYQQVYGMAMGSPISVTAANLVMEDVEQRTLNTCASPSAFRKYYVDGTFMLLPRGQVQQFHDHFNSIEPAIKFTIEMEQEGSRAFIDTRVTRNSDGSLTTTVFRKKTHLDWYLDFDSHHPLAHKVVVAQTLLTQADRICTSIPDRDVEKKNRSLEPLVAMVIPLHWYRTGT